MKKPYQKRLLLLIGVSLLVRSLVAGLTELGNDEVYYWTYALFPDWSHFDHPPMVGWVISLFTGHLTFDSAFMLRLPALVLGTLNTWLAWRLGLLTGSRKAGWYAAILYTGSLYATVLTGTFILPDAPLATFYLSSLYFMFKACGCTNSTEEKPSFFFWAGLLAGGAMLSKYTGAFLWAGTLLYLLLYNRKALASPWLWAGIGLSLVLFSPVIAWNVTHRASGLLYHAERVAFFGKKPDFLSLGRELAGSFLYNNPINVVLMVWAIRQYLIQKHNRKDNTNLALPANPARSVLSSRSVLPVSPAFFRMVLCQSVPMIAVFVFFSLFRNTLPHWSAPAFFPLLILAATAAAHRNVHKPLRLSLGFVMLVLVAGTLQIRTGMVPLVTTEDVSLDMYGWKQLGTEFRTIQKEQENLYALTGGKEGMPPRAALLATRWFPAAHLDYYVAKPAGTVVKTTGTTERTHKYEEITALRGGIAPNEPLYYIQSNRYPQTLHGAVPIDTVFIYRCKKPVLQYIIHRVPHPTCFRAE
ncbi:MAG: glycosyltransferase family 39 protein [Bacteroidales bacterium]|nr:glycosyltransferase family 39 protein [Bacteroidales bacterium]